MITVLGHKGFIGSEVVRQLALRKIPVQLPERDEDLTGRDLGNLIYCIGLTADAKRLPFETLAAHLHKLEQIIRHSSFEKITYASSARIYVHGENPVSEKELVRVDVSDPFELFNLSKLTAESLLFNTVEKFHSVRYSNVYGLDTASENFLSSIIGDALQNGKVTLRTTPESAKDYISVSDAARMTIEIALRGVEKIYNVASGFNTTNDEILGALQAALGCRISYTQDAKKYIFPPIDISRIRSEFGFKPGTRLMDDFNLLINEFRKTISRT